MPTNYNTFTLKELSATTVITIPIGSYNKNNLMTTLATLLTAGSITMGHTWVYTVTYPAPTVADTFKYTFNVTGNSGQPSLIMNADNSSPFRQLGFETATTNTFVANTLVATNALNLSYILRMYIKSNISQSAQDGILEQILSVGSYPPLSIVFFQQFNFDMNTKQFDSSNVNGWFFTLVDDYDQVIDLNGIPWSFTLVFFTRNNTHEIHKTELKINNEQRMFNIENEQNRLKQSILGQQATESTEAIFAPQAYGSSSIIPSLLPPDIKWPAI